MNKNNRKELERAIALLTQAMEIIESQRDEEQEKFDNLGESLQQTERGQQMEETVEGLETAISDLEVVIDTIEGLI